MRCTIFCLRFIASHKTLLPLKHYLIWWSEFCCPLRIFSCIAPSMLVSCCNVRAMPSEVSAVYDGNNRRCNTIFPDRFCWNLRSHENAVSIVIVDITFTKFTISDFELKMHIFWSCYDTFVPFFGFAFCEACNTPWAASILSCGWNLYKNNASIQKLGKFVLSNLSAALCSTALHPFPLSYMGRFTACPHIPASKLKQLG